MPGNILRVFVEDEFSVVIQPSILLRFEIHSVKLKRGYFAVILTRPI